MRVFRTGRLAVGLGLLVASAVLATVAFGGDANAVEEVAAGGLSPLMFFIILLGATTLIGIFAVLAGVGGGVVFTPLFMGFTSIDSYIIRATGLLIAMAGALVASKPYLRRGRQSPPVAGRCIAVRSLCHDRRPSSRLHGSDHGRAG